MAAFENRQLMYIKTGIDFVLTSIKAVLEHLEGQEMEKFLEEQKMRVIDYLKMEIEYKMSKSILDKLRAEHETREGTMNTDMVEEFQKQLEEEKSRKSNEFEIESLKKHARYLEMEQIISGSKADSAEVDDDMVVSAELNTYTDPWSKKPIETPVRNRVCGHVYDKSTAQKMCSRAKGKLKCPVIGCKNNNLKLVELEEDHKLKQLIHSQLL